MRVLPALQRFRDETEAETTSEDEAKARADHPLLASVLDDLAALAGTGEAARLTDAALAALSLRLHCQVTDLTPEVAGTARQLLLTHLRECKCAC